MGGDAPLEGLPPWTRIDGSRRYSGWNLAWRGPMSKSHWASQRRIPRWRTVRPLLQFETGGVPSLNRRLRRARTIGDLRELAHRRVPRAVFDYTDGAAESEISIARARRAFREVEFHPNVLHDVSVVNLGTQILGKASALPFVFAPTGFTRMMHHEGERAVGRVAERTAIPYALSTLATTSLEDVATAAPNARKWFQLYVWKDRGASGELVDRARAAGYEALVVTVDTPVAGARLRDVRNGLTIPPSLTLRTVLDGLRRPGWWFDLMTTAPLEFASLSGWDGTVAELVNHMFDPSVTVDDLRWIRERWSGPIVVKGIQSVEDALVAAEHGTDAIVLSNHGGRQLDRATTPLHLLPHVVDAVGDRLEVLLDGGILCGGDVLAAKAHGASACLIGRAYLFGLMAGGERGVQRAVDILSEELRRTLQLLGVADVNDLAPRHVTLPRGAGGNAAESVARGTS